MEQAISPDPCVVLLSGGMDSVVVLHHAAKFHDKIIAISFNYNQRHLREINLAQDYVFNFNLKRNKPIIKHKIIDFKPLGEMLKTSALTNLDISVPDMKDVIGDPQTVTYVPNRNMMFLSVAASIAEANNSTKIYYGAAKADDTSGYWDCTQQFRTLMNSILSLNRRNLIQIEAPLIEMDKKQIIEYGLQMGVDFSNTHTCYNVKENSLACGYCASCSARIAGWIQIGRIDPIKYARQINWEDYNCKEV